MEGTSLVEYSAQRMMGATAKRLYTNEDADNLFGLFSMLAIGTVRVYFPSVGSTPLRNIVFLRAEKVLTSISCCIISQVAASAPKRHSILSRNS